MKSFLKILFALACFIAATAMCAWSEAGILFGDNHRTVIHQYGPSEGYSVRYERSYSTVPTFRTYRVYRGSAAVGYAVPAPAAEDGSVVVTESAGRVKHKERHGKRSKVSHVEKSR